MKTRILQIAALMLFLVSGMATAQTAVPNVFQAGTPARATEVNENFDTVEDAVNQNAAAIITNASPLVFSNGQAIGPYLHLGSFSSFAILSPTNYVFDVISNGMDVANDGQLSLDLIFFEFPGCAGRAFIQCCGKGDWTAVQGFVFRPEDPADPIQAYYVPKGSAVVNVTTMAQGSAGGCVDSGPVGIRAIEVFPNDPIVTGVLGGGFTPPKTIGRN